MNIFLKHYELNLTVEGPVFIGDGNEIKKNEYILDEKRRCVTIPKPEKMFSYMEQKGLQEKFEDCILKGSNLKVWLDEYKIPQEERDSWTAYTLGSKEIVAWDLRNKGIRTFIKDPYGYPYVPGSSVKGALRNILMCLAIEQEPEKYRNIKTGIVKEAERKKEKKKYLDKPAEELENICFRTLRRNQEDRWNAVNDKLSGVRIADSSSISLDQMILCQKIDAKKGKRANRNGLPIMRECLKPGTGICLPITIDEMCGVKKTDILEGIKKFSQLYYEVFLKYFSDIERPEENTLWIGGGTGFITKTVVYSLLGYEQGVKTTARILETLTPRKHKHEKDVGQGVSPHICKMTKYQEEIMQMGNVKVELD